MSSPITMRFPMPPARANDARGWKGRHFGKQRYYADCDTWLLGKLIPKPPKTPWAGMEYTATLYVFNRFDDDNASAQLKWPLDWLELRGYVVNDREARILEPPRQVISRGKDRRSEVVLQVVPIESQEAA